MKSTIHRLDRPHDDLARLTLRYSTARRLGYVHSMRIAPKVVVCVAGEMDNASYEWLIREETESGALVITEHSDAGYGSPAAAMRDGLTHWLDDLTRSEPANPTPRA